jgi:predicted secreted protein
MKRSLALIATAVSIASCAHQGPLLLGEADTGRSVQLEVGQTLTLRLAADLGTGRTWQIATAPDGRVLIVVDSGYGRPQASAPGAAGHAWWVLRATGAGSTSIALRYGRPWESAPDARQFTVSVTVK